jgi:antitoxin component of MazEF toxin-antitoxin module
MTRARVVKLNSSLYVNVPAEEARRLGLREGQIVEVEVKPLGSTASELMELKGKYKGKIPHLSDRELWGEDWGGE